MTPHSDQVSLVGQMVKKKYVCNAGDPGLIPWVRKILLENGRAILQYSCLENSMDRPWGHKPN